MPEPNVSEHLRMRLCSIEKFTSMNLTYDAAMYDMPLGAGSPGCMANRVLGRIMYAHTVNTTPGCTDLT